MSAKDKIGTMDHTKRLRIDFIGMYPIIEDLFNTYSVADGGEKINSFFPLFMEPYWAADAGGLGKPWMHARDSDNSWFDSS
jgi:hypothetical protein